MASIPQWTRDDDKRFELALVQFPEGSPSFLENIAQLLQKPLEEVKYYYEALVNDVALIESGKVALPKYPEDDDVSLKEATQSKKTPQEDTEGNSLVNRGTQSMRKEIGRAYRGKCVKTRSPKQVATHAQKYFARQNPNHKKGNRLSIYDKTLDSTTGKPDLGKQNPPDDDESQGSCLGT